ncbi:hypothetical protein ACIBCN_05275 [Nocardia sp. NPDC051052]|uniref:hypothetical protein n=1 Tax=Nocardia sp. NPDC051052 TaxID=3364322 RepID=UPI0037917438
MHYSNRPVATVAALGALAAVVAFAAPQAGATVTSLGVDTGQSFGSSAGPTGTSCSYAVAAKTDPGQEVVFLDEVNAQVSHGVFRPAVVTADAAGVARSTWIPSQKGQHNIWVVEYRSDDDYDAYSHDDPITVGTGINVGPACVVLP